MDVSIILDENPRLTWWRRFLPQQPAYSWQEALRVSFGAVPGIALTGLISTAWFGPGCDLPLLIAPMGASAVLLFGAPASLPTQQWSIMGGNLAAALIGATAAHWIASPVIAAAAAMGFTFAAMSALLCVHPPAPRWRSRPFWEDRISRRLVIASRWRLSA